MAVQSRMLQASAEISLMTASLAFIELESLKSQVSWPSFLFLSQTHNDKTALREVLLYTLITRN
jgi:hypothetical protein